jgi:hypothetical protein
MASTNKITGVLFETLTLLAIAAAVALAMLGACQPASGADCRQFFSTGYQYNYQAQYVAPLVAYAPAVVYQAGQGIEAKSLIAKEVRAELSKALPQIVAQLRADSRADNQALQQQAPRSAVAQYCGKCHSGAEPKGGITLDGLAQLSGDQIAVSLEQIRDGAMPKDHKLPDGAASLIMDELLKLRRPSNVPPPIPSGGLE